MYINTHAHMHIHTCRNTQPKHMHTHTIHLLMFSSCPLFLSNFTVSWIVFCFDLPWNSLNFISSSSTSLQSQIDLGHVSNKGVGFHDSGLGSLTVLPFYCQGSFSFYPGSSFLIPNLMVLLISLLINRRNENSK